MHSSKRGSGERETSSSWVTTARPASCIARGSRVCHSAPAPPGPTPFPRTANSPEFEGNCTGNELGLQPVPVPELVVVVEAAAEFVDCASTMFQELELHCTGALEAIGRAADWSSFALERTSSGSPSTSIEINDRKERNVRLHLDYLSSSNLLLYNTSIL